MSGSSIDDFSAIPQDGRGFYILGYPSASAVVDAQRRRAQLNHMSYVTMQHPDQRQRPHALMLEYPMDKPQYIVQPGRTLDAMLEQMVAAFGFSGSPVIMHPHPMRGGTDLWVPSLEKVVAIQQSTNSRDAIFCSSLRRLRDWLV